MNIYKKFNNYCNIINFSAKDFKKDDEKLDKECDKLYKVWADSGKPSMNEHYWRDKLLNPIINVIGFICLLSPIPIAFFSFGRRGTTFFYKKVDPEKYYAFSKIDPDGCNVMNLDNPMPSRKDCEKNFPTAERIYKGTTLIVVFNFDFSDLDGKNWWA